MLTVIIPHHLNQNQHLLDWCLESILKQDVEKEVIVVADSIKRPDVPKGVTLYHAIDGSLDFCSKKLNTGIRLASPRSTHLFTGADDIILGKNALSKMQQASGTDALINPLSNCDDINILKQAVSSPFLLHKEKIDEISKPECRQFIHEFEPSTNSQFVVSTNRLYLYATMIPMKAIHAIGPMDENFEAGWEDEDYCLRASINKFNLAIDTSSYVYHIGGQTIKYSGHNPKNKEYFKKKWGIDLLPAATMPGYAASCAVAQKMNTMGVTLGDYAITMGQTPK